MVNANSNLEWLVNTRLTFITRSPRMCTPQCVMKHSATGVWVKLLVFVKSVDRLDKRTACGKGRDVLIAVNGVEVDER